MVELGEVNRNSGFEHISQAQRELDDRIVPAIEIALEIEYFRIAWKN